MVVWPTLWLLLFAVAFPSLPYRPFARSWSGSAALIPSAIQGVRLVLVAQHFMARK